MQTQKQIFLVNLARLIATASALTVVTLVGIYLFDNPYSVADINRSTQWIMTILVVMSLVAASAAWQQKTLIVTICFATSFVPVGLYLLLTPGIFALLGVAHLGFLLSALLLARAHRR